MSSKFYTKLDEETLYYFSSLVGNTGLKKGIRLGIIYIICIFPGWLIDSILITNSQYHIAWSSFVISSIQYFTLFAFLGFFVFDYSILKGRLGKVFRVDYLFELEDMPSLTTLSSSLILSLLTVVGSASTGIFADYFKSAAQAVVDTFTENAAAKEEETSVPDSEEHRR